MVAQELSERLGPPLALPPPDLDAAVQRVLDGDSGDVRELALLAVKVRATLDGWLARADHEPAAARTFVTMSRAYADIVGKLAEMRPQRDVMADRLEALGEKMRADLIARARKAATPSDLLIENARLKSQNAAQLSSMLAMGQTIKKLKGGVR
jgi:hypothetical protein